MNKNAICSDGLFRSIMFFLRNLTLCRDIWFTNLIYWIYLCLLLLSLSSHYSLSNNASLLNYPLHLYEIPLKVQYLRLLFHSTRSLIWFSVRCSSGYLVSIEISQEKRLGPANLGKMCLNLTNEAYPTTHLEGILLSCVTSRRLTYCGFSYHAFKWIPKGCSSFRHSARMSSSRLVRSRRNIS